MIAKNRLLLSAGLALSAMLLSCQSAQTGEAADASGEPSTSETREDVKTRKLAGQGCMGGNCDTGTGTFIYDTGDRYTGPFEKGKREGTGVMEYANGDRYEGEYLTDVRQGNGTYIFRNKDVYAGRFNAGLREGRGAYTFSETGEVLEGEFQEDATKGKGYIKRGDNYYMCSIVDRKVLCDPNPVKHPAPISK